MIKIREQKTKTRKLESTLIYLLLQLILIGSLSSCRNSSSPSTHFEETEGILTIKNPSDPLHPSLALLFKEELSIGVVEGDENYMLGWHILLNIDNQGNFYIGDVERAQINKYDPQGNFLFTIGRRGQGPGEFQVISKIGFDEKENLYVFDVKSQKISLFNPAGELIKEIKIFQFLEELTLNPHGYHLARKVDNIKLKASKKWDYTYGFFDQNFNFLHEILRLPQEVTPASTPYHLMADTLSKIAFQPQVSYDFDQEGNLYFGYPQTYEIKKYSPQGELIQIIQRRYQPQKVTNRDKKYFQQIQTARMSNKFPPNQASKIFKLVKFPQFKPAYESFKVMDNGWLFVIVSSGPSEEKIIDLFDKEGIYIGQFKSKIPTEGLMFKGAKAYAVATIDGYKFVKRYQYSGLKR